MDEKYLQNLWDWTTSNDPTFSERYTFESWSEKLGSNQQYRQDFHNWVSSIDETFSERRPFDAWESLVKKKIQKKEVATPEEEVLDNLSKRPTADAYQNYPTPPESTSGSEDTELASSGGKWKSWQLGSDASQTDVVEPEIDRQEQELTKEVNQVTDGKKWKSWEMPDPTAKIEESNPEYLNAVRPETQMDWIYKTNQNKDEIQRIDNEIAQETDPKRIERLQKKKRVLLLKPAIESGFIYKSYSPQEVEKAKKFVSDFETSEAKRKGIAYLPEDLERRADEKELESTLTKESLSPITTAAKSGDYKRAITETENLLNKLEGSLATKEMVAVKNTLKDKIKEYKKISGDATLETDGLIKEDDWLYKLGEDIAFSDEGFNSVLSKELKDRYARESTMSKAMAESGQEYETPVQDLADRAYNHYLETNTRIAKNKKINKIIEEEGIKRKDYSEEVKSKSNFDNYIEGLKEQIEKLDPIKDRKKIAELVKRGEDAFVERQEFVQTGGVMSFEDYAKVASKYKGEMEAETEKMLDQYLSEDEKKIRDLVKEQRSLDPKKDKERYDELSKEIKKAREEDDPIRQALLDETGTVIGKKENGNIPPSIREDVRNFEILYEGTDLGTLLRERDRIYEEMEHIRKNVYGGKRISTSILTGADTYRGGKTRKGTLIQGGFSEEQNERAREEYLKKWAEYYALSKQIALNEDPSGISKDLMEGFDPKSPWSALVSPAAMNYYSNFGTAFAKMYDAPSDKLAGDLSTTDREVLDNYVSSLQRTQLLTEEQIEKAKRNFGEKLMGGLGSTSKIALDFMLTEFATGGAGGYAAFIANAARIKKLLGGKKVTNVMVDLLANKQTYQGLKFELAGQNFATGVGEGVGEAAYDRFLRNIPGPKFLRVLAGKMSQAVGMTAGEYSGEFVDALSQSGSPYEAFAQTIGDDPLEKLAITYIMSQMFGLAVPLDTKTDMEREMKNYKGENELINEVKEQIKKEENLFGDWKNAVRRGVEGSTGISLGDTRQVTMPGIEAEATIAAIESGEFELPQSLADAGEVLAMVGGQLTQEQADQVKQDAESIIRDENVSEEVKAEIGEFVGLVDSSVKAEEEVEAEPSAEVEIDKDYAEAVDQEVVEEVDEDQKKLEEVNQEVKDYIVEKSNDLSLEESKSSAVSEKMSRKELINENEITEATDELYEMLDEVDNRTDISEEAKSAIKSKIESEITKLEDYEFETETKTRTTIQKATVRGAKKVGEKTKRSKIIPSSLDKAVGKKVSFIGKSGDEFGGNGVLKKESTPDGKEYFVVEYPSGEKSIVGESGKPTVNYDKSGNPVSVTLSDKSGNQVTVKDQDFALDEAVIQKENALGPIEETILEEVIQEVEREVTTTEEVIKQKPKRDAVQKRESKKVDVGERTTDGTTVVEERKAEEVTEEVQEEVTPEGTSIKAQNISDVDKLTKKAKTREKKRVLKTVKNVVKAMTKIAPDVEVVIHENQASYEAALIRSGGKKADSGTRGFFDNGNQIHINLERAKNNTALHEGAHVVMASYLKRNPKAVSKFYTQINKLLSTTSADKLRAFAGGYVNPKAIREDGTVDFTKLTEKEIDTYKDEFVTEALARISDGEIELTPTLARQLKELFVSILKAMGMNPKELNLTGKEGIQDFSQKLTQAFITGDELTMDAAPETTVDAKREPTEQEQGTEGETGTIRFQRGEIPSSPSVSVDTDTRPIARFVKNKSLKDFEGKNFITNMYDFTSAGLVDLGNGYTLNMYGGKMYVPLMLENRGLDVGDVSNLAAFNSEENALAFIENSKKSNATIFVPHVGGLEGSWQFQHAIFEGLTNLALERKILSKKKVIALFNSAITSKDGKKEFNQFKEAYKKKTGKNIRNFNGFLKNPMEIVELLNTENNFSPDLRKRLNSKLSTSKEFQAAIGVKNRLDFAKRMADPLNEGAVLGDLMSIVEFDNTTFLEPRKTKKGDPDYHPSFAWTVEAKIKGIYQPTEFYQSNDVTDSYVKHNKDGTKVSRETDYDMAEYNLAVEGYQINDKGKRVKIKAGPYKGTYQQYKKSRWRAANVSSSAGAIPKVAKVEPKFQISESKKNKIKYQIIGEKASLRENVRDNLSKAKEMDMTIIPGIGEELDIRMATGWEKGVDGKWRYEIPDINIIGDTSPFKDGWDGGAYIVSLEDFASGELLDAYPEIGKEVTIVRGLPSTASFGTFGQMSKTRDGYDIFLSDRLFGNPDLAMSVLIHELQHVVQDKEGFPSGGDLGLGREVLNQSFSDQQRTKERIESNLNKVKSFLDNPLLEKIEELLEKDKTIQVYEFDKIAKSLEWLNKGYKLAGLTPIVSESNVKSLLEEIDSYVGDTSIESIRDYQRSLLDEYMSIKGPKTAYEAYKRLVGEVEARNVQSRMKLSEKQRKETLLEETEDVAREDQILIRRKPKFQKAEPKKLLAPNGKPSNLNEVQHKAVRTPEFKRWFGDWENDPENASKVVDENGEPLVMYHGTRKEFNIFSKDKAGSNTTRNLPRNQWFWFADNKDIAQTYGQVRILPVFLNVRNPEIAERNLSKAYEKASKQSLKDGIIAKDLPDTRYETRKIMVDGSPWFIDRQGLSGSIEEQIERDGKQIEKDELIFLLNDYLSYWEDDLQKEIVDIDKSSLLAKIKYIIKLKGKEFEDAIEAIDPYYHDPIMAAKTIKVLEKDGVEALRITDPLKGTIVAAKESNQIKLADGTNRTFDPTSKDIRFQKFDERTSREGARRPVRGVAPSKAAYVNQMTSLYMQQNPDANRSETKEYFESEYDRVGKPKFQRPEKFDKKTLKTYMAKEYAAARDIGMTQDDAMFEILGNTYKMGVDPTLVEEIFNEFSDVIKEAERVKKVGEKVEKKKTVEGKEITLVRESWKKVRDGLREIDKSFRKGVKAGKLDIAEAREVLKEYLNENGKEVTEIAKISATLIRKLNDAKTEKGIRGVIRELDRAIESGKKRIETKERKSVLGKIKKILNMTTSEIMGGKKVAKNVSQPVRDYIDLVKIVAKNPTGYVDTLLKNKKIKEEDGVIVKIGDRDVDVPLTVEELKAYEGLMHKDGSVNLETANVILENLQEVVSQGKADFLLEKERKKEHYKTIKEESLESVRRKPKETEQEKKAREAQRSKLINHFDETVVQPLRKTAKSIKNFTAYANMSIEYLMDILSGEAHSSFKGKMNEIVSDKLKKATSDYRNVQLRFKKMYENKLIDIYGSKRKAINGLSKSRTQKNVLDSNGDKVKIKPGKLDIDNYYINEKDADGKLTGEIKRDPEVDLVLSEQEASYIVGLSRNQDNLEHLRRLGFIKPVKGHKGKIETFEQADMSLINLLEDDFISPEVREFLDFQMNEFYPELYEVTNDTYVSLYGIPLEKISNYMPRRVVSTTNRFEPTNFTNASNLIAPNSIKTRSNHNVPLQILDAESVLLRNMDELVHFSTFGNVAKEVDVIFKTKGVRDAITDRFGDRMLSTIEQRIESLTRTGQRNKMDGDFAVLDKLRIASTVGTLGLKGTLVPKQLTSVVAFAVDLPVGQWANYLGKSAPKLMSIHKEMKANSAQYSERTKDMGDVDIKDLQKAAEKSMLGAGIGQGKMRLMNLAMSPGKFGDSKAILIGGAPVYSYHKAQFKKNNPGATEQQAIDYAIRKFEDSYTRSQQSGEKVDLSKWQDSTKILKMFSSFKNSPLQYFRQEYISAYNMARIIKRSVQKGEFTKESANALLNEARRFFMYHTVLPAAFQWVTLGAPGLLTEWDDEDTDDMLRASLLGNVNAPFMIGDIISWAVDTFMDKPYASDSPNMNPTMSKVFTLLEESAKLLKRDKLTEEQKSKQRIKLLRSLGESLGIPVGGALNIYEGGKKMSDKEFKEGAMRAFGWSEYLLENDGKKKKKKKSKSSEEDPWSAWDYDIYGGDTSGYDPWNP